MPFPLKKILLQILLPPGIFIFFLWAIAFLLRKKAKSFSPFLFLLGGLLYLLSITPIKDALFYPLEKTSSSPSYPYSYILLLGGGMSRKKEPTQSSFRRVYKAFLLYKKNPCPIFIAGGKVYSYLPEESKVLKDILISWGIPEENIFIEAKSRDTYENLLYIKEHLKRKKLLKKQGALITSYFHVKRVLLLAKKVGISLSPYPADSRIQGKYDYIDFLPTAKNLLYSKIALKEYIGLLYYSLLE